MADWQNRITEIKQVTATELRINPANWRRHPQAQASALKGLLSQVGIVAPLIAYHSERADGALTLVDGHLRHDTGGAWPVAILDIDDAEADLLLATFDPITGMAEMDTATLAALLGQVALTPVEDEGVQALLATLAAASGAEKVELVDAEPQIDKAEELRAKWGVELGDLWALGNHRLICGDCTDAATVARLMDGERAQVLFTSPPYWVGFEYENENKWGEILAFIDIFCALHVQHVNQNGRIIINTGTVQAGQLTDGKAHMRLLIDTWANALDLLGWRMRYVRFWVKDGGLLHTAPTSDCIDQHTEFLGYFYNPLYKFRGQERTGEPWAGKGYWDDIPGSARQSGHVAAFPVELVNRNLRLFTRPGEIVLEPFSGSGTTIISCEALGRQCRSLELSPAYVAVTLERYAVATGHQPTQLEAAQP